MAKDGNGLVRAIRTLYDAGSLGGLEDAELLSAFLGRGEASSAAFEAIVTRHAAMVLGVCRAFADSEPDAEDAFQATFLVLAYRAGKVRNRASLGPWLFGVARRLATRARTNAARRRIVEARAAGLRPTIGTPIEPDDAIAVLIEEVDRLPARYREPLVLCHLQGMTYEAAARRLGCPLGTLAVRIRRAKARLRTSLERRGVDGASALAAFPGAAVPKSLAASTASLASLVAPAIVKTGVPASVLSLTRGALTIMRIQRIAAVSTAFLALAAGAWAWHAAAAAIDEPPSQPAAKATEASKPVRYQLTGRVVDEEGQPAQGAVISVFTRGLAVGKAAVKKAVSGADGTYTLDLPPGNTEDASITPPPGWLNAKSSEARMPFALSSDSPTARRDFTVKRGAGWAFHLTRDGRPISQGTVMYTSGEHGIFPHAECDADGRAVLGIPREKGEVTPWVSADPFTLRFGCLIRRDDQFHPESVRSVTRLDGKLARYWATDREGRSAFVEEESEYFENRMEVEVEGGRLVIHFDLTENGQVLLSALAGTVVDGEGKSVDGARVETIYVVGTTSYLGESDDCATTTDEFGRFRLEKIPGVYMGNGPTAIRLAVTKDGFAGVDTPSITIAPYGKIPPTAPPIVLEAGCSVTGVVLGPDGKPVEGAWIEPNGSFASRSRQTWTDSDGRFTVTGLPEGEISLCVRYGELTTGRPELVTATRDLRPVEIRLKKR